MNSIIQNSSSSSFNIIYNIFAYSKPKGKIDTILEPLQSMIQLALLSICPVGTKLRIQENILYLQSPTIIQPFSRWYHSDKKMTYTFYMQLLNDLSNGTIQQIIR